MINLLRKWYVVAIMVVVAGSVVWLVLHGMPWLNGLRTQWEAQRLQDQWEKPYREEKYGGKTPEETYDMFISALSKGDTTLASKYFVVDKQARWSKTLEQYKQQDLLNNFIAELHNTRKIWKSIVSKEGQVAYEYHVTVPKETSADFNGQKISVPAGNYAQDTVFEINSYTKVWKINSL